MLLNNKIDPQVSIYRQLAPWQRLAAACQLYWFAREIIQQRIRRNDPSIGEAELEKRVRAFL